MTICQVGFCMAPFAGNAESGVLGKVSGYSLVLCSHCHSPYLCGVRKKREKGT